MQRLSKLTGVVLRWLVVLAAVHGGPASADTTLSLYSSFAGNVNFVGTQKTLRTGDNTSDNTASTLVTNTTAAAGSNATTATLSGLPATGTNTIRAAYLYWAASGSSYDYTVTFEGSSVTADRQYTVTGAGTGNNLTYFSGVADVTSTVATKLSGVSSYTFTLSGLTANNGSPWYDTQAVLAGWALLVIYENATTEAFRVLNVYEGFQPFQGSSITLTASNFKTPASSIDGRLAHLTWEGDSTNSQSLNGYNEKLTFNGNTLTDANNPSNNQFNSVSTIRGAGNIDSASYGVDFDVYDVSSYLSAGATSATSVYSSGQDLVLLSAEIISVTNTPVSDMGVTNTRNATPAYGTNYTYTITGTNNGPVAATSVKVTLTLSSALTYVSATGSNWTCTAAGQVVTCNLSGSLASGASAGDITLTVQPNDYGTLSVAAAISSANFDNVSSNDSATDSYNLLPTPYAYYAMNESSWSGTAGEVADSSGNGRNASTSGGISTVTTGASGSKPDTCRGANIPDNNVNGTVQAINTGVDINDLGNAGTIAFWYKSNRNWNTGSGNNDDRTLFDATSSSSGEFWLVLQDNGQIRFRLDNASNSKQNLDSQNYSYSAGTWVHIAVTWNFTSHSMCLYINGALDNNQCFTDNAITSTNAYSVLYVGDGAGIQTSSVQRGYSADGAIDELRLYSGALSQTYISLLMNEAGPCAVHHVRLLHDGAGDLCAAEPITVQACSDPTCSVLSPASVTTTLSTTAGTWSSNPVTFTDGSTTSSLTATATGTATIGASKPSNASSASTCYNSATASSSCTVTFTTCSAACATTLSGVVNTYYPGAASVAAGATTVTLGTASGATTSLKPNDVVLVVQMQDATINSTNTSAYGSGGTTGSGATNIGNSGLYEYKVVQSFNSSTGVVTFTSALVNSYTNAAATSSAGKKSFQLIRVPVLQSYTMATPPTAMAWNGSTGGVLAFDVTGTLTFSGNPIITVDGMGFAGGVGRQQGSGSGSSTDYRTYAGSNMANGSKGEGIAGTPNTADTSSSNYGYPNGSNARGAPGNAGGGATDGNPSANDENTGGGGGAGYGSGGKGGIGWCSGFNASQAANSYNCSNTGGFGGTGVTTQSFSRLIMGGGGGAATSNNGTGSPGSGVAGSGAAGGGMIFVRAGALSGAATFSANGSNANNTVCNDGSGGGGGGGAVLIQAASGLGNIAINAKGGNGGTNLNPVAGCANSTPHGPGGGGGGGYVYTTSAPASCTVTGGSYGYTYNNGSLFGTYNSTSYGAAAGSAGACANNSGTAITTPGGNTTQIGAGPCAASLSHYAVSHSGTGITCEAEPVTIYAHDTGHALVSAAGRTITVKARNVADNTYSGTWVGSADSCSRTCYNTSGATQACTNGFTNTASNNGQATYTFGTGEAGIRLCLKQSSAITQNMDVSDALVSETSTNSEDQNLAFSNTGFRFYADNVVDNIGSLVAGLRSDVTDATYQPSPQVLTIRALKSSETTPARCVSLLGSATKTIQFAYQCTDPASCQVSNGLEVNDTAVAGSAGTPTPASDVPVAFDASGYGSIKLKYWDVGKIQLYAAGSVPDATTGANVTITTGASNTFLVKPYGFLVIPCNTAGTGDCTAAPTGVKTDGTGNTFVHAGDTFKATISAVAFDGTTVTKSFGLGTSNNTETVGLARTLVAPTGMCAGGTDCTGILGGTTSLARSSFSSGVATVADLTWSEVGVIKLTAANTAFQGATVAANGSSGNLGRFYPHHFGITGTVVTRSDLQGGTEGQTNPFTYMGEPMRMTLAVTAYNASDGVTQNYGGNFAKLSAATLATGSYWFDTSCSTGTQCMGIGARSGTTGLSSRWSVDTSPSPTSSWSSGVGTFTVHTVFSRNGAANGPYDTLQVGAMPQDSDGVTLPGTSSSDTHAINFDATTGSTLASNPDGTAERRLLFTTAVRYGIIRMANAYGSELLPLPMPMQAQYFSGTGWVQNTWDSLTALTLTPATDLSNFTRNLALGETTPTLWNPLRSGNAGLSFSAPGAGNNGSVLLTVTVPSYLRYNWNGSASYSDNPSARATFGVFKNNQIFLRESY